LHIAILRCAALAGGGVASPLARYLAQAAPRTLLGFDPRIQVLHPADAAVAFALAAVSTFAGPLNIAADQPLTLAHAIRLAERRPLPLPGPLLDLASITGAQALPGLLPFPLAFLRYPCVADPRRARAELGWQPQYSAVEALQHL
jgi:UDP-glucose 4-epimerase